LETVIDEKVDDGLSQREATAIDNNRFDDGASSHPVIDDAQKTLRRSRHIISAYRLSNVLSRLGGYM
jgi:hypothetical protein